MKKWELKDLIDKLEGKIISLQMDNGQLRTRVRNLKEGVNRQKERVNRHNERSEQLEKELISLRNDRDCIQESLDEFGSDTVEVIEMPLEYRLTMEETKVYEEGMRILNSEGEMTQHDIEVINSCHCGCPSREEVEYIVWNVLNRCVKQASAG